MYENLFKSVFIFIELVETFSRNFFYLFYCVLDLDWHGFVLIWRSRLLL